MATNKLAHKGFTGSFEVSLEDGCLIGRVLFIDDMITYEGESVPELTANFETAVDRYLEHCKQTGKAANKPYSGTFNVRVGPDLHREAAIAASEASVNLNEFVASAIKTAVAKEPVQSVVHNHSHVITIRHDLVQQPIWSAMATSNEWEKFSATTLQ